jgi:hypothetical protein
MFIIVRGKLWVTLNNMNYFKKVLLVDGGIGGVLLYAEKSCIWLLLF